MSKAWTKYPPADVFLANYFKYKAPKTDKKFGPGKESPLPSDDRDNMRGLAAMFGVDLEAAKKGRKIETAI